MQKKGNYKNVHEFRSISLYSFLKQYEGKFGFFFSSILLCVYIFEKKNYIVCVFVCVHTHPSNQPPTHTHSLSLTYEYWQVMGWLYRTFI